MSIIDLPAWQDDAACRHTDPSVFFPMPMPTSMARHGRRKALRKNKVKWQEKRDVVIAAYCDTCSVEQECLEYALTLRINDGIWGGTTNDERRVIIRERRQAAG